MGEPVKMVATKLGILRDRMVQPGESFLWSGPLPIKWAIPAAEAAKLPPKKDKPISGDTKPPDAIAAVKRKAEGFS